MIWDVAVVGAGPAGSTVAAVLARRGRRVAIFERSCFELPRIGETLGAEVEPLLRAIGAWESFSGLPRVPFRRVESAWGTSRLSERASISHPFGDGYHVERARFDAFMAETARKAGARLCVGAGLCTVEACNVGFRVRPPGGSAALARFVVDASGRGAPATASLPGRSRWLSCDRLVGLVGRLVASSAQHEPDLLLEASEDGWWYSAPQPGGSLVVALMTDADLTPAGPRSELMKRWRAALERTGHTRDRVGGARASGAIRIVRADSGYLLPAHGSGFCAVGDAAMACDPLAGNGVARALKSGIDAADAVDAQLSGAPLVESAAGRRLAAYLDRRARYYGLEGRWPAAPFWARRRTRDWTTAPLTLSPTALLRWDGTVPARHTLAPVEALLPRSAIDATLALLRGARPAHAALSALRDRAPLGDRRLLVGLQALVECGAVECVERAS